MRFAYLVGDLLLAIPFILIYWRKPKLRREMVICGAVIGLLALLTSSIFIRDYWQPQFLFGSNFRIEEFLYGFFIGGVASVLYDVSEASYKRRQHPPLPPIAVVAVIGITVALFVSLVINLGLSSLYLSALLITLIALAIYFHRPDLIVASFAAGMLTAAVTFVMFQILIAIYPNIILEWWDLTALTGLYVSQIPIEELLWAFCLGLAVGPGYEIIYGLRHVRQNRR